MHLKEVSAEQLQKKNFSPYISSSTVHNHNTQKIKRSWRNLCVQGSKLVWDAHEMIFRASGLTALKQARL